MSPFSTMPSTSSCRTPGHQRPSPGDRVHRNLWEPLDTCCHAQGQMYFAEMMLFSRRSYQ
jgi:hypothetical protein